jgi:hypothetical protein
MQYLGIVLGILFVVICIAGCTGQNQDEEFKILVLKVADDFTGQKDIIMKPYQGLTTEELLGYRAAATEAKTLAEGMSLSDAGKKARSAFIPAMDATIGAVDALERDGKLSTPGERVSLESVNSNFVSTQTGIDDTCDLLGIEKEKAF